jgi:hypothetical protein
VPDADSFDDYEDPALGIPRGVTPVSTACEADDTITHAPERPSRYCVRVAEPGFVLLPALRLAIGRYLTDRFALGLSYQFHFVIDPESFLGAHRLGAFAEQRVLGQRAHGASFSLHAELAVGRTETPVATAGAPLPPYVNALSGPFNAELGGVLRWHFNPRFAVRATPTFGAALPELQWLLGMAVAAEVSPF